MRPTERPRFKVCCIANAAEAQLAIDAGASAVGLVSTMPSGRGPIADDRIAEIAALVPPGVDTFLLTAHQDADAIVAQHRATGTTTVQLVDDLPAGAYARLRRALPATRLVQVVHVTGPESLDHAERAAEHVHAVLLDSGNPHLAVKELGGTGRRHDWTISARIRERLTVPVLLAGGLTPDNAAEALATVRPYALDVCTGLRDRGFALDPRRLARFAATVTAFRPAAEADGPPDHDSTVLVRPAVGRDVDEIARVWTQGWREAHLGHVPEELVVARTPESFRIRARENLDRTVIAEVDGHIAGLVVWCDDEIEQLYLAADRRGRGVARSLLRAGEARIAELGHDEAWLAVVAGNARARAFYARCGWIDSGPFSHHAPGGITVPAHRYTRALIR